MELPESEGVEVGKLSAVFADVTNSYKFYWLLAILDNLQENGQARISMRDLCLRMMASVWYPLDYFKLSFGKQDSFKPLAASVSELISVDNRPSAPSLYQQLRTHLSENELSILDRRFRTLRNWVPYRFIRPFFGSELRSLPDPQVNARVTALWGTR